MSSTDIETEIKRLMHELEGKSDAELKQLYDDALVEEVRLKTELTVMRQRSANMPSDADVSVELEIIAAKEGWRHALAWLKALEMKLHGYVKDYSTGSTFGENR